MTLAREVHKHSKRSTTNVSYSTPKHCLNCGKLGHVYRQCSAPLTSYGIIMFRLRTTKKHTQVPLIEYLMICRRHTFGYVEFIRVNFDIQNEGYIRQLLSEMTQDERTMIRAKPFSFLWTELWQNTQSRSSNSVEYQRVSNRFNLLRNSSMFSRLDKLIGTEWTTPEWGFPKGKRNYNENSLACALREMAEETGISKDSKEAYRVLISHTADTEESCCKIGLNEPEVEMFQGTDGRRYRHVYFIAEANACHQDIMNVSVDPTNILQTREVSEVRWLSYDDCLKHIRSYNTAKLSLLTRVHPKICAYSKTKYKYDNGVLST